MVAEVYELPCPRWVLEMPPLPHEPLGLLPRSRLTISPGSPQDTVLDACSPETPAVTSQPTALPMISEGGLGELESVRQELLALQEELREVAEPRRAAWESRVS